jgi:hypothetical protein
VRQSPLQEILGWLAEATPEETARAARLIARWSRRKGRKHPVAAPAPPAQEPEGESGGECVFCRVGNRWKVILNGARPVWLPNILGSRYLNYLLHEPNDPIDPFALEVRIQPEKALARAKDSIQAGSDGPAKRDYRERLRWLQARRATLGGAADPREVEGLVSEMAVLEAMLKERELGSDTGERARNNVRKAIDVIKVLLRQGGPEERAVLAHLDRHLSIGHRCLYSQPRGRIWG